MRRVFEESLMQCVFEGRLIQFVFEGVLYSVSLRESYTVCL